jgi:hypothetical protein
VVVLRFVEQKSIKDVAREIRKTEGAVATTVPRAQSLRARMGCRCLSASEPGNNDRKQIEQLNKAVETMLSRADGKVPKVAAGLDPLLQIAANLRALPRESFKARLKSEFEGEKRMSTVAEPVSAVRMSASPRLAFRDPAKAIEFYTRALGATETFRFEVGGSIPHAEIMIGESSIAVTGEWPEEAASARETLGNSPISLVVQVPNVDAFAERAVAAE